MMQYFVRKININNSIYFLTLDHVGHCLAGDIKEPLNVKVVGCQNQLKECSLINLCQKIGQILNKGGSATRSVLENDTPVCKS